MNEQPAPMASKDPLPSFDTRRLHLRPLAEGDEALYCRLYTDAGVMRHIAAPLAPEAAQRAFHKVIALMRQPAAPMRLWVLTESVTSVDLGFAALIRDAQMSDAVETGTMLLAAGQGRGLAAEAQAPLLDWLFSSLEVRRVWCRHASGHDAVIGMKLKQGFVRVESGEAANPEVRWQMTSEQWQARRGGDFGLAM